MSETVQRVDARLLVYTDGGVMKKNPSPIGGMMAFRIIREGLDRNSPPSCVMEGSKVVTPDEAGLPWISCNLVEGLAILLALESLLDGRSGLDPMSHAFRIYSDSENAIRLWRDADERPAWFPLPFWNRLIAVREPLPVIEYILLGGHPNRLELAAGFRKDGKPVSRHNVWCDEECTRIGQAHFKK